MAGRREVPVDPAAGPVQRFAFELRKLRAEAGGLTYRVLAQRAGYGVTALSQAAAGEQLPTLPVVLAYVKACGGDPSEWEARWKQAVDEAAASSSEDEESGEPPYRGLARFEPGDSGRFFGRDKLTADVLELVRRRRFAAVFGASGSGKSSLLRAGLIPALRDTQDAALRPAAIRILAPGQHPARAHARVFDPGGTRPGNPGADTFVIVDQFEEVFTLCHDPVERARFLDLLLTARQPESRLRVLIAVRADFYGHCAEHRDLADALRDANLLVGPMTPAELREAIVGPGTVAGLTVERALTSRLVKEVADAPGGLPLLSHVLMETWRRRRGKTMTLAGYEAAGGIEGAVAKTAEDACRQFTEAQADAARRMLLRLVAPGDGTPDTRRPTHQEELEASSRQETETAHVLQAFTRARLLTLDGDTVELAHEALLTAWPRLRGWIEQDRERLRVHRKLTEAAGAWEELGRDVGALYRGTRLATAEEAFIPERQDHLTTLEHAFLSTSLQARDREQRAATRATRRLYRLKAGLSAVMVLALTAGAVAWQQNRFGDQRLAEATSRRVAAVAEGMRYANPVTAMRLSVAAWRISPTLEAKAALVGSMTQREQDAFTGPGVRLGDRQSLSSDGRILMTTGKRQVHTWTVDSHQPIETTRIRQDASVFDLSPDGRRLLVIKGDMLQLQDASSGRTTSLPFNFNDTYAMFTPNRHILKIVTERSVGLWDIRRQRRVFERQSKDPDRSSLSSDGRFMALCPAPDVLEIWDAVAPRRIRILSSTAVSRQACGRGDTDAKHFLLDSTRRTLMVVTSTGLRAWNWNSGQELPPAPDIRSGQPILSRDGELLTTSDNTNIRVWRIGDLETPAYQYPLNGRGIRDVRLDPNRKMIRYIEEQPASTAVVRTLYLGNALDPEWHSAKEPAPQPKYEELGGRLTATASGPPGSDRLATGDETGRVTIWDQAMKRRRSIFTGTTTGSAGHEKPESVTTMRYSPDGQLLAVGGSTGTIRIWDAASNRPLGSALLTPGDTVQSITFDRSGTTLTADGEHTPRRTYPIAPELVVKTVCQRSRGGMRRAEWKTFIPEVPYGKTC
ncbi:helix-turn-helix domain-containing protein [Streptomyces avermitilis]|uniref:nSTAND1 domain-containing NTPase n=1 Tax=Streptomyces avermitilis TaxID=33903 RepID=UPI0037FFDCAD